MEQETLTFESVNQQIEAADLRKLSAISVDDAGSQICAAYKFVRPILKLLLLTPFIPKKWKEAIEIFIKFMDNFCPQN